MKKSGCSLESSKGFTTIELLLTVTILGILLAIMEVSYDAVKSRVRYAQIKANLDIISQVAYSDFTSNKNNDWAAMVMPGNAPSFVGTNDLPTWPQPPCPGWMYSYDNYFAIPGVSAVRLTVRRADLSSIWSYCLDNYGGNCEGDDGFGGHPPDISSATVKHVYCSE
jgi:prepilin-type N-terminal cleavage/methylation domain-containing protein